MSACWARYWVSLFCVDWICSCAFFLSVSIAPGGDLVDLFRGFLLGLRGQGRLFLGLQARRHFLGREDLDLQVGDVLRVGSLGVVVLHVLFLGHLLLLQFQDPAGVFGGVHRVRGRSVIICLELP